MQLPCKSDRYQPPALAMRNNHPANKSACMTSEETGSDPDTASFEVLFAGMFAEGHKY